jgi:hypothetical protein
MNNKRKMKKKNKEFQTSQLERVCKDADALMNYLDVFCEKYFTEKFSVLKILKIKECKKSLIRVVGQIMIFYFLY